MQTCLWMYSVKNTGILKNDCNPGISTWLSSTSNQPRQVTLDPVGQCIRKYYVDVPKTFGVRLKLKLVQKTSDVAIRVQEWFDTDMWPLITPTMQKTRALPVSSLHPPKNVPEKSAERRSPLFLVMIWWFGFRIFTRVSSLNIYIILHQLKQQTEKVEKTFKKKTAQTTCRRPNMA